MALWIPESGRLKAEGCLKLLVLLDSSLEAPRFTDGNHAALEPPTWRSTVVSSVTDGKVGEQRVRCIAACNLPTRLLGWWQALRQD